MEKTTSGKSIIAKVFSVFKSKRFRNFFYLLLIVFASFSMLCIDKDNMIREQYLPFLNENILADLMGLLGIARYEVTSKAWVLFIILITVATVAVVGSIIAPKFVEKKVKANPDLFSSEKKARVWYTFLFYLVLVLIAAVIIVVAYFAGAFNLYNGNEFDNNPFMSLLTMLGFFLAFVLAFFIALIIIIFVVRLLVLACTGRLFNKKAKQKAAESEIKEAATEPKNEKPITQKTASKAKTVQAESPVIINDIKETNANVAPVISAGITTGTRKSIKKSFTGKLAQATKEQKGFYGELKNYMLSFKRVNSRVSWNYDSFNIGRNKVVKIAFRGQTMCVFFALNPKDYKDTKYYPRDMGNKRKFADTPMMVKVKSQRGVKFAKELMAEVCKDLAPKKNFVPENYDLPYMSDIKLVENGLAK